MALLLIVSYSVQPGKGEDFARAFAPVIDEVREEPGCSQYELFRSADDPDRLVLLERWDDQASLDAHLEAMRARGPSPTAPFRAGDATVERYES